MNKIQLIEDGNLTGWARTVLIFIGFLVMYLAYKFVPPAPFGGLILLFGFAIALVGGFTSRAHLLRIKPFDNSYKKARKSYETKEDES